VSEVTNADVTLSPSPGTSRHLDRFVAQSHDTALVSRACVEKVEGTKEAVDRAWVQQGVLIKGEHPGVVVALRGKATNRKVECGGDTAVSVKPDEHNSWQ
jgi:hypothetical protein